VQDTQLPYYVFVSDTCEEHATKSEILSSWLLQVVRRAGATAFPTPMYCVLPV